MIKKNLYNQTVCISERFNANSTVATNKKVLRKSNEIVIQYGGKNLLNYAYFDITN